jgi:hypothetical protein
MPIRRYIKAMSLIGNGNAVLEQIALSGPLIAERQAIRVKTGAAANPSQADRSSGDGVASPLVADIGISGPFQLLTGSSDQGIAGGGDHESYNCDAIAADRRGRADLPAPAVHSIAPMALCELARAGVQGALPLTMGSSLAHSVRSLLRRGAGPSRAGDVLHLTRGSDLAGVSP